MGLIKRIYKLIKYRLCKKDKAMGFELDRKKAEMFRSLINDNNIMVILQKNKGKWGKLCVVMDRLQDTTRHLNLISNIQFNANQASVFGFYDILNHGMILIDCIYGIDTLLSLDKIQTSNEIFGQEDDDKLYFEYLRSLCSAHPFDTKPFNNYSECKKEYCHFVKWKKENILEAAICDSDGEFYFKEINIVEVLSYIEKAYNHLDIINEKIEQIRTFFVKKKKQRSVRKRKSFEDTNGFIDYLMEEERKRFFSTSEYLESAKIWLNVKIKLDSNSVKIKKYFNAIKLSLDYYGRSLQYIGTVNPENENDKQSYSTYDKGDLLTYVIHPDKKYIFNKLNSEEALYLKGMFKLDLYIDYPQGQKLLGKLAYEKLGKALISKYFDMDNIDWDDPRVYLFYQASKYFECLEYDTFLSNNIPNNANYRLRLK